MGTAKLIEPEGGWRMFARLARYKIPQSRFGEVIPAFKESVEGLREMEGHAGGYLIVDPENCTALTLTLWESQSALQASEMRATRLRGQAIDTVDGEILSVESGEVALDFSQTAQV